MSTVNLGFDSGIRFVFRDLGWSWSEEMIRLSVCLLG